jgi:demethylmenaquinone methyltransferase/2-methoxy-6-polyprenyl-1,4-benzoquinol methylase
MDSSDPNYVKIVKSDFSVLSDSYDLINNFMSMGTDRQFRYIAIKNLISNYPKNNKHFTTFIDIGTGTGHLGNELDRQLPGSFVVGLDVTRSMIEFAKNREIYSKGLFNFVLGDAAKTPFRDKSFDGGMSGFVGRHFTNYPSTLSEHNRILRINGRLMMLEMGRRATRLAFLIDVYVGMFMSLLGKLAAFIITKGNVPFRLLEETYARYYSPRELKSFYEGAGFITRYKLGLLGSIVIMLGKKK